MGYSYSDTRYAINGVLDTSKSVMENLTQLCNAAGTWLTYDIHEGKWSVIINQAGTSVSSFDDSNIIGPININGTGLYNLYNQVDISYTHEDLKGQKDIISIEIPAEDRNANEPDNTLNLSYDIVTNPVQAQLLGFIELKQSRVDKIIVFRTDHSKINTKAGDIIDITTDVYGFDQKLFRVITVKEVDDADNSINIEITALEYDDAVYDTTNLSRYIRSDSTGILPIGAIQAPNQPTITKYEVTSRPRITISTVMNIGIADTMEFWISYNVPPTVNDDASRTYTLLTTAKPKNGANFAVNEVITADFDSLNSSSFFVKARATNSSASSPFSAISAQITYTPVQTTNAIDANTTADDGTGNLLKGLALTTLLNALASAFNANTGTISGSGGAGGGTTFLLLTVQNFNSNATTGGGDGSVNNVFGGSGYGSKFVPVIRIVPPGVPSIIEGIDQTSLSQCIIGDGYTQTYDSSNNGGWGTKIGFPNRVKFGPTRLNWPDYYPHKIVQVVPQLINGFTNDSTNHIGGDYFQIAVDLGVYKYYYPTATKFELEVRGFWLLYDRGSFGTPSDNNSGNITVSNDDFHPTTVGTAPIRIIGNVWTKAAFDTVFNKDNPYSGSGTVFPTSWETQGIGTAANVVVTSSIYPEALGSNHDLLTTGTHITTFKYDFTTSANAAPSFNPISNATPISTTITVPTAWSIEKSGDTITKVVPSSNVTISSIPKTLGTTEIFYSTNLSPYTGLYNHYHKKRTWFNDTVKDDLNYLYNSTLNEDNLWFPVMAPVEITANVFSSSFILDNQQKTQLYPDQVMQEYWSNWGLDPGVYFKPGSRTTPVFFGNTSPLSPYFYSNMAKISTTSLAFLPVNFLNKSLGLGNEVFIPTQWAQLAPSANVSAYRFDDRYGQNQNDFDEYGVCVNGQYFGASIINEAYYPMGVFHADRNLTINHIATTGNINANAISDTGGAGYTSSGSNGAWHTTV